MYGEGRTWKVWRLGKVANICGTFRKIIHLAIRYKDPKSERRDLGCFYGKPKQLSLCP